MIDSFEKASIPGTSEAERKRLLSFVVVGGGPTSCEFVAELHDFATSDIKKLYPDLIPYVKVSLSKSYKIYIKTLYTALKDVSSQNIYPFSIVFKMAVEAGPALLGPFDSNLQNYTKSLFENRDIDVRLGTAVTAVEDYEGDGFRFPGRKAKLSDGSEIPFGTLVWSAGLKQINFSESLDLPKGKNGRLLVDDYLRVKGYEGSIWAMGDCAMNEKDPLPELAQVARQQGMYIADIMNGKRKEDEKAFNFFNLGSMASVGGLKGLYDGHGIGPKGHEIDVPGLKGFVALLLWRFAYWGRQTSIENKILIPIYWMKSFFFGRDVSRF